MLEDVRLVVFWKVGAWHSPHPKGAHRMESPLPRATGVLKEGELKF